MKSKALLTIPALLILFSATGAELAVGPQTDEALQAFVYSEKTDNGLLPGDEHSATAAPTPQAGESTAAAGSSEPGESSPPVPEALKIVVTGDIMLGRGVEAALKRNGKSYDFVFEEVAELLIKGDVVFGNLEQPITDSEHSLTGIGQGGKWVLRSRPESFTAIRQAGYNLFSLANNHILDFYEQGLVDTMELLAKNDIAFAGAGMNLEEARKPAIIEEKGVKIGLLAYTDMAEITYKGKPPLSFLAGSDNSGVAPRRLDFVLEDIKGVRDSVDILMVSLHWGIEDSFDVHPSQVSFAHELIDAGADMIVGHHAHQFQGIEIYRGKPIFYSLGNFIFDQNDPENQESFIINLKYSEKRLVGLYAVPVRTIDKCRVVPQKGEAAAELLQREEELCKRLGTQCEIRDDVLMIVEEQAGV